MSEFVLNNKLSHRRKQRDSFQLGDVPLFESLANQSVQLMRMTLDERIGAETTLLVIDKTPSSNILAQLSHLNLQYSTGLGRTSQGCLAFLLFYIPNEEASDTPLYASVCYLNPFDDNMLAAWGDLDKQSHWHVILVDAQQKPLGIWEIPNPFGIVEFLHEQVERFQEVAPLDYADAVREFCRRFSVSDLIKWDGKTVIRRRKSNKVKAATLELRREDPKVNIIQVDTATLWLTGNVKIDLSAPGIYNCQVCTGGRGWPAPYRVGIYLDADYRQCCIIDWPHPCKPIKFKCEYGSFVAFLDTATADEILSAKEVAADFFRDD
jgi:hypothetical protein